MVDSTVPCMGKVYHRFWLLQRFCDAMGDGDDAEAAEADVQQAWRAACFQSLQEQHEKQQPRSAAAANSPAANTRSRRLRFEDVKDQIQDLRIPDLSSELVAEIRQAVMSRWEMAHTPFHAAAYALDPEFQGHRHDPGSEVHTGLMTMLSKLVSASGCSDAKDQYLHYQDKTDIFSPLTADGKVMWEAAATMPAHRWWMVHGSVAPELSKLAVRVLAATSTSSSCERNWSTYEFIQSRRRNKLTTQRCNDLVFVFSNMQLIRRLQKAAAAQVKEPTIPWLCVSGDSESTQLSGDMEDDAATVGGEAGSGAGSGEDDE
jgi:hypothetical protein